VVDMIPAIRKVNAQGAWHARESNKSGMAGQAYLEYLDLTPIPKDSGFAAPASSLPGPGTTSI
jgi:hypothetical protein